MDILKKWILPIGIILCGTVLVTSIFDRVNMPRYMIWCAMTIAILVCTKELRLGKIHYFAFGYLVFVLVSGMFAVNRSEWLAWSLKVVLAVSFLSVVVIDEKLLAKAMIVLGIIFAVYFWYDYNQVDGFRFCRGLMRQKNTWAAAHFFVIPFCYYAIKNGFWCKLSIVVSIAMVAHICLLGSRMVMLAVFVSIGIVLYKRIKFYLPIAGVICAVILFYRGKSGSLYYRYIQWKPTMSMIADYPMGVGAGNWRIQFPKYAPDIDYPDAYSKKIFRFPHNDFVWVWAETGTGGIICYLGMFFFALCHAWKKKAVYLLIALSGYMTIAFFSSMRERPFSSLMMMVFIALACDRKYVLKQTEFVVVSLVFAIVVFGFRLRASYWEKRVKYRGHSVFSTLTYTGEPFCWWLGLKNYKLGNMKSAAFNFQKAYSYNPNSVQIINGMGVNCLIKGDHISARHYFKEALRICPKYEEPKENMNRLERNNGSR